MSDEDQETQQWLSTLPGRQARLKASLEAEQKPPSESPTRATTIPSDPVARKRFPIASGVLSYFPDAIVAISEVSYVGNEQHNPGQPLHWDRSKSCDEDDAMMRHFMCRGTKDSDGQRHSAKLAWRALAALQKEIEEDQKK